MTTATAIPNEIWLNIGQYLDIRDLVSVSLCNRNLYNLFASRTVDAFKHFCPWYRSNITPEGVCNYFCESRGLTEGDVPVELTNSPLPDSFECILGGQMEYAQRFFVDREFGLAGYRASFKCWLNDRGLQCGNCLVYLSDSRLPWHKGGMVVIDHQYSLGQISFEIDKAKYTYCDDFMSPEALVIEARDNDADDTAIYGFKLLSGPNVKSFEPDFTVIRHPHSEASTSFLAGTHLFNDLSEPDNMLLYINGDMELHLGEHPEPEPLKGGVVAVYEGKFYFFSNDKLMRVTYLGTERLCKQMVLSCFPDCRYIKQDDRHPRYLCGVGDGHVMQFIIDLKTMVVLKMPVQDNEGSIYMPGVVDGVLKCFVFSLEFVRNKLKNTPPSDEDGYIMFP